MQIFSLRCFVSIYIHPCWTRWLYICLCFLLQKMPLVILEQALILWLLIRFYRWVQTVLLDKRIRGNWLLLLLLILLCQKLVELSQIVEVLQICSSCGLWNLSAYLHKVSLRLLLLLIYYFRCEVSHLLKASIASSTDVWNRRRSHSTTSLWALETLFERWIGQLRSVFCLLQK